MKMQRFELHTEYTKEEVFDCVEDGDFVLYEDIQRLENKYQDAREMINQVYEIVEMCWVTRDSPYNKEIKKEWLRKAREIHGADPMP